MRSVKPEQQFARNLREARLQSGFSQEELAERCQLHATEISRLERGVREPRLSTIVRLARGLKIPVADLVEGI
jgi:transcriptional regulator with XRE-family HTH domain